MDKDSERQRTEGGVGRGSREDAMSQCTRHSGNGPLAQRPEESDPKSLEDIAVEQSQPSRERVAMARTKRLEEEWVGG